MGLREVLFFVHAPKCAGTSFMQVLGEWFGDDLMRFDASQGRDLAAEVQRRPKPPKAIGGHFLFGVDTELLCQAHYVSLVRDPVDRFVSLYKHARRTPDHLFHGPALAMSLEAFLTFSQTDRRAERQTRAIQCYFLARQRTFEQAKPIVDTQYSAIALTEDFSQFVSRCSKLVGRTARPHVQVNVSPPDAELDAEAARLAHRIRAANPEDFRLYEHVRGKRLAAP